MMRRLAAAGLLAGTLSGAAGFGALSIAGSLAADRAEAATSAQTLSAAAAGIASARSTALSAAVSGGTSSAASTRYDSSVADLGDAIAKISGASDVGDLSAQTTALTTYAAAIGRARGQGAAGVSTLIAADPSVADATARVSEAARRASARASSSTAPAVLNTIGAGLVGTAATVGLIGCSVWLARRTHRVINPPLAIAALLTAGITAATVTGATSVTSSITSADATVTGSAASARTALVLAGNARSKELHDVAAGSDTSAVDAAALRQSVTGVVASLDDPSLTALWRSYATEAERTAALPAAQNAQARTSATGAGESAYAAFARALHDRAGATTVETMPTSLSATRWAVLLGGLLAGGLCLVGFGQRLREYRR